MVSKAAETPIYLSLSVIFCPKMAAFSPAFCDVLRCRTKIIDEHSSHHGSAAAAQAKVEALQDSLRRRPQGGGHGGAQEGDTRSPN